MVDKDLYNVEIDQLVEELNMSREQAETLVKAHEDFVDQLQNLNDVPFSLSLILTTAISIASAESIPPAVFIQLVVDVMEACSDNNKQPNYIADA